jgi:hypothetical protein
MRRLFRMLAALSCALLLLGNNNCVKNSGASSPQFVTSLAIEDVNGLPSSGFATGAPIKFVLTIRNRSDQAQTLYFSSSELINVAVVQAGSANVVWSCDNDTTTACIISQNLGTPSTTSGFFQIVFAAFETKTVTVTWNQSDDSAAQVNTGSYEVIGGFTVFNTTGPGSSADNGNSMATGAPTSNQMFPTVFRSTLTPFTVQ